MRLGGWYFPQSIDEMEPMLDDLDAHGLSAILAPFDFDKWRPDACAAFGAAARGAGLVVGEMGFWENLMTDDADLRARRIAKVRAMLKAADAMGCLSIVTLVGTKDPSDRALAPHAYMYTDDCRHEFREVVLRILDGLELRTTKYIIEPWHNTFFYQPADIRAFIDSVDHPSFGLHLDQMNMVGQHNIYRTTELINETFDLLAPFVVSVHLKDIRCDATHMFLKYDEVLIGDGEMDYETYLRRLAALPSDTPCYCEHLASEAEHALNNARLHHLAGKAGVRFLRRGE